MNRLLPALLLALFVAFVVRVTMLGPEQPALETDSGSAAAEPAAPSFTTISPERAAAMMQSDDRVLVLDVRPAPERNRLSIEGSVPVEVGDVLRGTFEADPERPIILVCAVGGRSFIAGKVMAGRGYRRVFNLDGGIEAWRRAKLPLRRPSGSATE